jgi:anti-sigma regulatory factor (Ser/Thr protein kinase)
MTRSEHFFPLGPDLSDVLRMNDWLDDLMAAHGVPEAQANEVKVCLDEAVTNVLSYAFDAPAPALAELKLTLSADGVEAELRDAGRPFDPVAADLPEVAKDIAEAKVGGLGLRIIRELATSVRYAREGGENVLTLTFAPQAPR